MVASSALNYSLWSLGSLFNIRLSPAPSDVTPSLCVHTNLIMSAASHRPQSTRSSSVLDALISMIPQTLGRQTRPTPDGAVASRRPRESHTAFSFRLTNSSDPNGFPSTAAVSSNLTFQSPSRVMALFVPPATCIFLPALPISSGLVPLPVSKHDIWPDLATKSPPPPFQPDLRDPP